MNRFTIYYIVNLLDVLTSRPKSREQAPGKRKNLKRSIRKRNIGLFCWILVSFVGLFCRRDSLHKWKVVCVWMNRLTIYIDSYMNRFTIYYIVNLHGVFTTRLKSPEQGTGGKKTEKVFLFVPVSPLKSMYDNSMCVYE